MKRLLDLLHENRRLRKERDAERARAEEWRERCRTLDDAFYALRCEREESAA